MKKTGKTTGNIRRKLSRKVMAALLAVMCIGLLFTQIATADEADVESEQEAVAEDTFVVDETTEPTAEEIVPEIPETPENPVFPDNPAFFIISCSLATSA